MCWRGRQPAVDIGRHPLSPRQLELPAHAASAVVSLPRAELAEANATHHRAEPGWATITSIEVRASQVGLVEMFGLTIGSWADDKFPLLTIAQTDRLRFRVSGLQSDLGLMCDGLMAMIVPPTLASAGRAVPLIETTRR